MDEQQQILESLNVLHRDLKNRGVTFSVSRYLILCSRFFQVDFFFEKVFFYIKVDQRVAQFEHGIYVPASHLPCGVNKGEISSLYFLLTTCR